MTTETFLKKITLKDGKTVELRPLEQGDYEALFAFFTALPVEDTLFLRNDVRDPEVVRRYIEKLDLDHIFPIVAFDGDVVVGIGTLHRALHDWTKHVGHVRLATASSHRHQGLGRQILRELLQIAEAWHIEKLQAHIVSDDVASQKMLASVGFESAALLKGMVKDRSWKSRDLAILVNDVADLSRIMEDWIQQSLVPQYRAPGGGA